MVTCLNNASILLTTQIEYINPSSGSHEIKTLVSNMSLIATVQVLPVHPGTTNKMISEVHTKENEGNILYHGHITEIRNHWQTLVNTANNVECYINEAFLFNHKRLNNQQNTLLLVVKTLHCLVIAPNSVFCRFLNLCAGKEPYGSSERKTITLHILQTRK
jgi:hypothetical protein